MSIRNIIVNTKSVRTVLQNHEAVSEQSVLAATDDPVVQATLVAGLNNALVEIMDHEESADVLSAPPSQMASLLQSFLAEKAVEEDKPTARELPSGGIEAKFDSKDWLGWPR